MRALFFLSICGRMSIPEEADSSTRQGFKFSHLLTPPGTNKEPNNLQAKNEPVFQEQAVVLSSGELILHRRGGGEGCSHSHPTWTAACRHPDVQDVPAAIFNGGP